MSTRTLGLKILEKVGRTLAEAHGIRPHALTIESRQWPGRIRNPGDSPTVTSLAVSPAPNVGVVSEREVFTSGGVLRHGDLKVDRITPVYPEGGYTAEQLRPAPARGLEVVYVISGGYLDGEYELAGSDFSSGWDLKLFLTRKNTTP